jgi:hypothetical protein
MMLKNNNLTLTLDRPGETYRMSRFDWNGFVTSVSWKDKLLTGREKPADEHDPATCGYGLHNEFGIEDPVGFSDCAVGDWYLKIGIGLLKKDSLKHDFYSPHEIRPLTFDVTEGNDSARFSCTQPLVRGYAYRYEKTISLSANGFSISYRLENTGKKPIATDEYTHNFLAFAGEPMDETVEASFLFPVDQKQFIEAVNPEGILKWSGSRLGFSGTPEQQYFFSNLTGSEFRPAEWTLTSRRHKLAFSESGDFETFKVNLWGWRHVLSPELFRKILLRPGETDTWTRTYSVTETD